jgi:hypothetical protein
MNEYVLAAIVGLDEAYSFWPLNHFTAPVAGCPICRPFSSID